MGNNCLGAVFFGYREQGWVAQIKDTEIGSGAWGDELVRLRDGRIVCTRYPAGYSHEAALTRGAALAEAADHIAALEARNARLEEQVAGVVERMAVVLRLVRDEGSKPKLTYSKLAAIAVADYEASLTTEQTNG